MLPTIDPIINAAIARRIFPGAVVLVTQDSVQRHEQAYGALTYDLAAPAVTATTIYDIASITKLFTATAALRLLDAGLLALDAPAAYYLPGLRAHGVQLRHLFTHTSGLDLRLSALRELSRAQILAAAYAVVPACPPGSQVTYTNINSLLLGEIVARAYGGPLEAAIQALLLDPLDLRETGFCPAPAMWERIAPTELDEEWRGGVVRGSVHDESAHALGGVAGHAGLFSTVADLERFARLWLNQGSFAGQDLLRPATVALALRDHTARLPAPVPGGAMHSGLGWMLDRRSFMGAAPPGTAGHTGFTGPVIVIQPRLDLAVIILSNRTYPHRTPPPFPHHPVTAAVVAAALA